MADRADAESRAVARAAEGSNEAAWANHAGRDDWVVEVTRSVTMAIAKRRAIDKRRTIAEHRTDRTIDEFMNRWTAVSEVVILNAAVDVEDMVDKANVLVAILATFYADGRDKADSTVLADSAAVRADLDTVDATLAAVDERAECDSITLKELTDVSSKYLRLRSKDTRTAA